MTDVNPYRPPQTTPPDAPASPRPARPPAVFLMMAALALTALSQLAGLVGFAAIFAKEGSPQAWPSLGAGMLLNIVLISGCTLLIVGLARARRWARLLCLVFLALLAMTIVQLPTILTATHEAATLGSEAVVAALGLWWGWALGFSASARRYFRLAPITSMRQLFTNRPR